MMAELLTDLIHYQSRRKYINNLTIYNIDIDHGCDEHGYSLHRERQTTNSNICLSICDPWQNNRLPSSITNIMQMYI